MPISLIPIKWWNRWYTDDTIKWHYAHISQFSSYKSFISLPSLITSQFIMPVVPHPFFSATAWRLHMICTWFSHGLDLEIRKACESNKFESHGQHQEHVLNTPYILHIQIKKPIRNDTCTSLIRVNTCKSCNKYMQIHHPCTPFQCLFAKDRGINHLSKESPSLELWRYHLGVTIQSFQRDLALPNVDPSRGQPPLPPSASSKHAQKIRVWKRFFDRNRGEPFTILSWRVVLSWWMSWLKKTTTKINQIPQIRKHRVKGKITYFL